MARRQETDEFNGSQNVKPRIVCLCGSTRFEKAYKDAMREETLAGKIVLSVGLLGHAEGIDMDGPIKAMLDELHLRKIDLADEVMVLNVRVPVCFSCSIPCLTVHAIMSGDISDCCGSRIKEQNYVGDSTRREIEYATKHGKLIRYLNPIG